MRIKAAHAEFGVFCIPAFKTEIAVVEIVTGRAFVYEFACSHKIRVERVFQIIVVENIGAVFAFGCGKSPITVF